MSEPSSFVEQELQLVLSSLRGGRIPCNCSCCPRCLGTRPGCKKSHADYLREEVMSITNQKNTTYTTNYKEFHMKLFFIFRVGHNHFCQMGMRMMPKNKLIDLASKQRLMNQIEVSICNIPAGLPSVIEKFISHVSDASRVEILTLTGKLCEVICPWLETKYPVASRSIRRKLLMMSVALGFLNKKLVPAYFRLTLFFRVYNQSVVRKKGSPSVMEYFSSRRDLLVDNF